MKVLHIIPALDPKLGGPSVVALKLCAAQRSVGIEAEIACAGDGVVKFRENESELSQSIDTVPIHFLKSSSLKYHEFIPSIPLWRWISRNLNSYDLIHLRYLFVFHSLFAPKLARGCGIPYVMNPMGQLTTWSMNHRRIKKEIFMRVCERKNLEGAAFLHCTSIDETEDVRRLGLSTRCVVAPLGVTLPSLIEKASYRLREKLGISSSAPVILFLSRIHPKKRLDQLLRVMPKVLKEFNQAILLVAGDGQPDYKSQLSHEADQLGISSHIKWCGFVEGEDKDLLLQGSDIFVLPSHSENFGIAVAEAMAAATAVVVSSGVNTQSAVVAGNTGIVTDHSDTQLSAAIITLLRDSQLRRSMGLNGREYAKNQFSWEMLARTLKEQYETAGLPAH